MAENTDNITTVVIEDSPIPELGVALELTSNIDDTTEVVNTEVIDEVVNISTEETIPPIEEPVPTEVTSNISETEVVDPAEPVPAIIEEPVPIVVDLPPIDEPISPIEELISTEVTSNISDTEVITPNEDVTFTPTMTSTNNSGNINGGKSNDKLVGNDSDDKIRGLGGNDSLTGGPGNDMIWGGQGSDQIFYLNLGEGVDKLEDFDSADKLVFNKKAFGNLESASFTSATVTAKTQEVGDASLLIFDQKVSVNDLPNQLVDLGVSDRPVFAVLPAQGQATQLVFVNGEKVDVIADLKNKTSLQPSNFDFFDITDSGELDSIIVGTPGKDILKGTSADDTMKGLGDNDRISSNDGNDYLLGGAGNDNLAAGTGNDSLFGNIGDDMLYGQDGNDFMSGGAGFDHLLAGAGNDILSGGTGGDRLNGGVGNDTLVGGGGKDRFIFNTNEPFKPSDLGVDNITDFTPEEDLILLDQRTFNVLNSEDGVGFSVASEFAVVNSEAEVAQSAALIVYHQASGQLFYNQNGIIDGFGTGGQFAVLENKAVLTSNDFQVRVV